jgi:transcriptional regulator with XRE-family HTH domain
MVASRREPLYTAIMEAMWLNIDEKLAALRRGRGLSQEELADALAVSRQAVGKWESGRAVPELTKLLEICDFYGVSLDSIYAAWNVL